jgi:hypothetical protein
VETDSVIVTVRPTPGRVVVTGGNVWVVVKVVIEPGWIDMTVVPACVKVVGIPGKLVVTKEVIVEAG